MRAQIVSFHCVLKDRVGKVISSTFNCDVITQQNGSAGELLQGLADGMQNLSKGEKRRISLSADKAYGFYDPKLVMECARNKLNDGASLAQGSEVVAHSADGMPKIFRVTQVRGKSVTLDGNHPLAGQDLVFEIETTDAREATSEEIDESRAPGQGQFLH